MEQQDAQLPDQPVGPESAPKSPPATQPDPEEVKSPVATPAERPGAALSKDAIDKRLRRVFTPRSDGTYSVSPEFVKQFQARGSERQKLLVMFEKCDYNPDWVC